MIFYIVATIAVLALIIAVSLFGQVAQNKQTISRLIDHINGSNSDRADELRYMREDMSKMQEVIDQLRNDLGKADDAIRLIGPKRSDSDFYNARGGEGMTYVSVIGMMQMAQSRLEAQLEALAKATGHDGHNGCVHKAYMEHYNKQRDNYEENQKFYEEHKGDPEYAEYMPENNRYVVEYYLNRKG